jgi:hypothetical protein
MLVVRKPVKQFFFIYALICLFTVLVFMAPATGEELMFQGLTLYNHDYRIRVSPRNLHLRTDVEAPPMYSVDVGDRFTPRFSQRLFDDMGVDASLRDAYIGLHAAYIQAASRYINASSLPEEFYDPFIAFMVAGKAVESSGNATPKNIIPMPFSASNFAVNPDILMQFSSSNLMGLSVSTYAPEDRNGDAGPLCIRHVFLGYPILPDELGVIGHPSGVRYDRDRPHLKGDRWNLYDSFNCIVGYLQADLNGKFGRIPDMYKENFYTRFCMLAYWHNAGASCVYSHSDKELAAEIAHILGGDAMVTFTRELIMEQVNAGNSAKMRGFLYGAGGNEDLIAKPVWERMYSLASPTLQARIDVNTYKYRSSAGRVNNGGTYTVRAYTGWMMIEMSFAGLF